ncbi:uncharacterized protein [Lepidochelys kempii]|uniref:uncharacterized protein isoform X4 n=1 Tax=Lepidochelys kempii TaxID=8472 RepID=UPI003C6FF4C5
MSDEDEDDFQFPPAPRTESRQTPVFESLKQARESGTDVDSHGSYVNISSEEKEKEYLEVLPLEAERTRPHKQKGPSRGKASLDEQTADSDYVNVP